MVETQPSDLIPTETLVLSIFTVISVGLSCAAFSSDTIQKRRFFWFLNQHCTLTWVSTWVDCEWRCR
ncbi:hypothetical protein BJX61DRAFT_513591 [Aspergillus egyptiacus]|nr:hypothetical protein BJX61DRAFT_513591 [Aspergillus egyptiacus]